MGAALCAFSGRRYDEREGGIEKEDAIAILFVTPESLEVARWEVWVRR